MKIAIVNSEYPSPSGLDHGGIATYTYTMAKALASLGHTIHVFVREGTYTEKLPDSVKLHTYAFKPPLRSKLIIDRFKDGIIRWEQGHARDIRDKLISIHDSEGLDIAEFPEYGALAGKCTSSLPFKIVINFHTPSIVVDNLNKTTVTAQRKKWYRYEQNALLNADGYRSPSEAMRLEACRIFNLDQQDIKIIRNPVSMEHFTAIKKKHSDSTIDILFAGRLEQRKGAELLLHTIKDILQISSKIHFTFAGETSPGASIDYRYAIERTLNEEQRSRIWFLGALPFNELLLLYCRSSVFLFPSVFENAPYALYEAIASKLPVIASDSGGIKEIIKHNVNGLLFSYTNRQELINCIKVIVEDPKKLPVMAEQAYIDLNTYHASETIAKESISLYKSIISNTKYR